MRIFTHAFMLAHTSAYVGQNLNLNLIRLMLTRVSASTNLLINFEIFSSFYLKLQRDDTKL